MGLLDEGRGRPGRRPRRLGREIGEAFLDEAQGRILLARDNAAKAEPILETVGAHRRAARLSLVRVAGAVAAAEALAQLGQAQAAEERAAPRRIRRGCGGGGPDCRCRARVAGSTASAFRQRPRPSAEPEITLAGEVW